MKTPSLGTYDILSFDCYGTLVDWESSIVETLQDIFQFHDANMNNDVVLEYFATWEPEEQAQGGSYRNVLRRVLMKCGFRLGFVPRSEDLSRFEECVARSKPFEDTCDSLRTLQDYFKLAIISNTDNDLFEITSEALGVEFAHVVTAENTGCYKPDAAMFEAAIQKFGRSQRVLHVAQSLFHDIAPAHAMGIDTVWIDRTDGRAGAARSSDATPTWRYADLAAFAQAMVDTS